MDSLKRIISYAKLGKRYAVVEGKENAGYAETPTTDRSREHGLSERKGNNTLQRNTSFTKSLRDVAGTVRQKLRRSTRRRKRLQESYAASPVPSSFKKGKHKRTPTHSGGYRQVKMYSPFGIETPKSHPREGGLRQRPRWHDVETPTRLRREVEELTANMQALVALTPNTLMTRSQSRRQLGDSPATTGRLRTRQRIATPQVRRQIQTTL